MVSNGLNQGWRWGGGFYWRGGGSSAHPGETNFGSPLINSPYFGWQVVCGASTCDGSTRPGEIAILGLELAGLESSGPTVYPNLLTLAGAAPSWVRGKWTIAFTADGPSGACQLSATLGGMSVSQPVNEPQNQVSWHQCASGLFSQLFDTSSLPSGPGVPLTMWARDAAYDYGAGRYLSNSVTKPVNIDNAPVTLGLSGPTDAPATAGPQSIIATADAGPSGVRGIWCSVDGSPYLFHGGGTEQIPVSGIGVHNASCYAENNAIDMAQQLARSPRRTWRLTIREPSVSTVSFARVVNALRCSRKHERVRVPARWVTVTIRGHRQRVKLPVETRRVTVVHCHARIVRRRVRIHGHWRVRQVLLLPHTVQVSAKRVPHGAGTTISGWLGTDRGNALGGQPVTILTAPDMSGAAFGTAATTTTGPDGSWSATLPPGPSRLARAVYSGTTTVEPSSSADAHIVVPAAATLRISPRETHWGETIRISGQLDGGFIPPAGELVVLWIGWHGGSTEIGHLYAHRDGRFGSTYTFLRGNGTETYRLWATTARESDYPFTSARSSRIAVKVNP